MLINSKNSFHCLIDTTVFPIESRSKSKLLSFKLLINELISIFNICMLFADEIVLIDECGPIKLKFEVWSKLYKLISYAGLKLRICQLHKGN